MFVDAKTLPNDQKLTTDVCIIGAGAAGITIAREFAGRDFKVAIVESGGLVLDGLTQALADGENAGLPYFPLIGTRLRFFGGTTNHWSGFCRPLNPIDLEAREEIPHSGWPIKYAELLPLYKRAHEVLKLGPNGFKVSSYESAKERAVPLTAGRFENVMYLHQPTRFHDVYKDAIEKAPNITTYLNANVVGIDVNEASDHATSVRIACLPGPKMTLSARIFILAAGTVENARLLLLSNQRNPNGLGNANDLVGRYFAEHPHFESGIWLPSPSCTMLPLYEAHWSSKPIPFATFALTEETLRREKLNNHNIALTPLGHEGRKADKYYNREVKDDPAARGLLEDLWKLTRPKSDAQTPPRFFALYHRLEQAPNPESRVTLSDKMDALGTPKARLAWRLSDQDRASLRRSLQMFAQDIGRSGLGEVRIDLAPGDHDWPKVPEGGFHHMGTTRMHEDPKQGVVDAQCRIHGMDNFYIAGSSVFPTYGYANPTMTLVALALRLADHLKETLR